MIFFFLSDLTIYKLCVWLLLFSHSVTSDSATPWTAGRQASLFFTIFQSLLKLMSIELMMPSNHLILCRPLLLLPSIFPIIRAFPNESVFHIRWPKYSALASVLPMNIQELFLLRLTCLIFLHSKELSREFPITQFKSINSLVLSFLYSLTLTSIYDYWKNHGFD